jgi:hypothetical protein
MLRHSLIMHQVRLPDLSPAWPKQLNLHLGLNEVLLLEGVGWNEATAFWQVAATLADPLDGEVFYWGKSKYSLTRPDLFRLRKQIAYIASGQVLLQHLTLGENIILARCYHQGTTPSQALEEHEDFLDKLGLKPFIQWFPAKMPELVLACLEGPGWLRKNQGVLREILEDWLATNQGAFLLAGRDLSTFYPLAHRLLRPSAGSLSETQLHQIREKSPVTFFPLA